MKKNYLIALTLTVISMSLSACGNETVPSANNQVTNNTPKVEETVEVESTEEVQVPEVEVETKPSEDTKEPEVEVESTEEVVEETIPEEPQVEMVDFETWAKQEGNDEICLVVWNEELGIQEIVPTLQETEKMYEFNEGDKFAIPYNKSIRAVSVNKEDIAPPVVDYREVSVKKGEVNNIFIIFENQQGEYETINYVLK